jgi:hypothetical protein
LSPCLYKALVHEIEIDPVDPYTQTEGWHADHVHAADRSDHRASRGIGRGIALKLAEQGLKKMAISYKENDATAEDSALTGSVESGL